MTLREKESFVSEINELLARLALLEAQQTALREAMVGAISRLKSELQTPDDMYADHIREAVRILEQALALPPGR